MGAKRQWAQSTNGPDWTDIEAMMRALESVHTGEVVLTVSTVGIGATGGMALSAHHVLATLGEDATHTGCGVDTLWPNRQHTTLEAAVYELLYRLDFAIGDHYQQEKIPT
jgi:hypothetical protein